jgi:salicylate hydroxylase
MVDEPGQKALEQTGFAAYRATVDVAKMKSDPEISWLLERPSLNIWYQAPSSWHPGSIPMISKLY